MSALNLRVPPAEGVYTQSGVRELRDLIRRAADQTPEFSPGLDTETRGLKTRKKELDWMRDTVTFWSTSFEVDGRERRWCLYQDSLHHFTDVLEDPRIRWSVWNLKYDAHVLWNCGVNIWNAQPFDAMLAAQLINENLGLGGNGLKDVAPRGFTSEWVRALSQQKLSPEQIKDQVIPWIPIRMTPFKSLFDIDVHGNKAVEYKTPLVDLPRDLVTDYASLDAYAHYSLGQHIRRVMEAHDISEASGYQTMWEYFWEFERRITEVIWRMERRGVRIDTEALENLRVPVSKRIETCEREIARLAGRPVDTDKPSQLLELLFGDAENGNLGLEPISWTKGGTTEPKPKTDEETLLALHAETQHPVLRTILDRKKYRKVLSTYVEPFRELTEHYGTGYIHPSINQMGAKTGRFSTNNPNCMDDSHEVLTEEGWRAQHLVGPTDRVMQWRPSGALEFVVPWGRVAGMARQPLHEYEDSCVSFRVTGDHLHPVVSRALQNIAPPWVHNLTTAGVMRESYRLAYIAGGSHRVHGPPERPLHEYRVLLAALLYGEFVGQDLVIRKLDTSQARLVGRVLSFFGNEASVSRNGQFREVRVTSGPTLEWIRTRHPDLRFGPWILGLPVSVRDFLCRRLNRWWHGPVNDLDFAEEETQQTRQTRTCVELPEGRPDMREWVPTLGATTNRKVMRQMRAPIPKPGVGFCVLSNRTTQDVKASRYREIPHSGVEVRCLRVPSGYVLTRRHGRIFVTHNSQNIPTPSNDEFGLRTLVIAEEDEVLIVADYSQIEMRILAHYSQDPAMLQAIRAGKDLHCESVSRIHGIPYERVKAAKKLGDTVPYDQLPEEDRRLIELRSQGKNTGFAVMYGAGPNRISQMTGLPLEDAKDLLEAYFDAYPGVRDFLRETVSFCRRYGYVYTILGRRRNLPGINSNDRMVRSSCERQAKNSVIQGSAADITKAAMLNIEHDGELNSLGYQLRLQIHDELLGSCLTRTAPRAMEIISDCMRYPFEKGKDPLDVETPISINAARNWAEAK